MLAVLGEIQYVYRQVLNCAQLYAHPIASVERLDEIDYGVWCEWK